MLFRKHPGIEFVHGTIFTGRLGSGVLKALSESLAFFLSSRDERNPWLRLGVARNRFTGSATLYRSLWKLPRADSAQGPHICQLGVSGSTDG